MHIQFCIRSFGRFGFGDGVSSSMAPLLKVESKRLKRGVCGLSGSSCFTLTTGFSACMWAGIEGRPGAEESPGMSGREQIRPENGISAFSSRLNFFPSKMPNPLILIARGGVWRLSKSKLNQSWLHCRFSNHVDGAVKIPSLIAPKTFLPSSEMKSGASEGQCTKGASSAATTALRT